MTTFAVNGVATIDGVPTNGLVCVAYLESRFLGTPPVLGSPVPDVNPPDGGPVSAGPAFGGTGWYSIAVPDEQNYWIGCWHLANPSWIAWEGPRSATPHTSVQGWTKANVFNRSVGALQKIAAGSNGAVLPQSTLNLDSSAVFNPGPGFVFIQISALVFTVVAFASITTSGGTQTLNGCTGGSGTLATGQLVFPAYQNGVNRRLVTINFLSTTLLTTDQALLEILSTIGGNVPALVGESGLEASGAGTRTGYFQMGAPVDPEGFYGVLPALIGTGTVSPNGWIEVDF
jgi:hypothetical protein